MSYRVNASEEFEVWFSKQSLDLQRVIAAHVELLEARGPQLGRPQVDTLKGSRLGNFKELRVQYRGEPYRILFAFDPKREALLLVGGNKTGDKRWYEKMIPKAEDLFEKHLETLDKED